MIARPIATLPWHTIALVWGKDRHLVRHSPFVIGRDADADLVIPGPAVSRRHARLVFEDGWHIEDLGSRNGVVVNGRRARGSTAVAQGDVLMLADVVLTLVPARSSEIGFPPARSEEVFAEASFDETSPVDGFLLFTISVDHALLSGETLEAERLFAVHLGRPAERAAQRGKLDAGMARTLSLLALRLGEATSSAVWLDFVLRIYAASGSVMPLPVVSSMHSLAHRLGGVDRSALRQYARELVRSRSLVLEERNAIERLQALATTRFAVQNDDVSEWPESRRILSRRPTRSPEGAPSVAPSVKLRRSTG